MRLQKPADLARLAKSRRQALGLTQQEVADLVGITRQSLARIERGSGGSSFDTVLGVFDTLGLRLDATPADYQSLTISVPKQVIRTLDTKALQRTTTAALAAIENSNRSAIASAATAALQGIDTRRLLTQVSDHAGEITSRATRSSLLDAAIISGDPDRADPPDHTVESHDD